MVPDPRSSRLFSTSSAGLRGTLRRRAGDWTRLCSSRSAGCPRTLPRPSVPTVRCGPSVWLLSDIAGAGYDAFVTQDANQLSEPKETELIRKSKLHHIRFHQDAGVSGFARAVGGLVAAMPDVLTELMDADGQRLVRITKLDRRKRHETINPKLILRRIGEVDAEKGQHGGSGVLAALILGAGVIATCQKREEVAGNAPEEADDQSGRQCRSGVVEFSRKFHLHLPGLGNES